MRLLLCIIVFVMTCSFAVAKEQVRELYNFSKHELGSAHALTAPLRVVKTDKGSMWFFFKDHVLKQDGAQIQSLSFADKVKRNVSFSTQLNAIRVAGGILFSVDKKLFFIDDSFESVEQLPFQTEYNIQGLAYTQNGRFWLNTLHHIYVAKDLRSAFLLVELPDNITLSSTKLPMALPMVTYGHDKVLIATALSTIFSLQQSEAGEINAVQLPFMKYHKKGDFFYDIKRQGQTLFIGAEKGLYAFDLANGQQQKLVSSEAISGVRSIALNGEDIWLSANGQLYKTDLQFDHVEKVSSQSHLAFDLDKTYVRDIFVDDEANVWVSLVKQGLYQYSPANNKFNALALPELLGIDSSDLDYIATTSGGNNFYTTHNDTYFAAEGLLGFAVTSFVEVGPDDYWLAGYDRIVRLTQSKITAEHKTEGRYATSLVNTGQTLWYTLNYGGLYSYDLASQKVKHHLNISPVQYLVVQNAAAELLSFNDDGIHIIDEHGQQPPRMLQSFVAKPIDLKRQRQNVFVFFDNGRVYGFNLNTNVYEWLDFVPELTQCLVYQSHKDRWWFGLDNGTVIQFDRQSGKQLRYDQTDGLPMGGADGLFCAEYRGRAVFSTVNGLFTETDKITYQNNLAPQLHIELQLQSATHSISNQTASIEIKPDDFPIAFRFTGSSYQQLHSNRLKYRLLGFEPQFKKVAASDGNIRLPVLPVGKYQLSAQVSNNDARYSEPVNWTFTVLPPLWLTWWAKLVYGLILLALLWGIYLARTRAIREKAYRLELLVADKTREVVQEKQIVEQLLSQKEQEFIHISHELRTPLTLINGPLNLALQKIRNKDVKGYVEMAVRSTARLNRLVDQLLFLERSRLSQKLDRKPQNISYIINSICQSFEVYAQRKQISLTVKMTDNIGLRFAPDAFEKILVNLLSNAVKYTLPGGQILVKAEVDNDERFTLTVKDTGIGISEEEQSRVFDKFHRVDSEQSEKETGAGIGLALVKELVEAHGGQISLVSEPGQGTEISVCFESASVNDVDGLSDTVDEAMIEIELSNMTSTCLQPVSEQESLESPEAKQTSALIIEDDLDMQRYMLALMTEHFHCEVAPNGKVGVEKAVEMVPDLIICDVMMPVMDGFEATKRLKENEVTAHIPVIMLTARNDKSSRLGGWQSLADEYIAKPFDAEELLLRSRNLLSIRQILRQRYNGQIQQGQMLSQTSEQQLNAKDSEFVDKITGMITDNLDNEHYTVQDMIQASFMSERQLQRKLKALIDFTPREYIQHVRLMKAQELLRQGKTVAQTSELTGFSSASYFSRCFKAKFNLSPKQFTSKLSS